MCGIAGWMTNPGHKTLDRGELARMLGVMKHRGPDGEGTFVHGPVALGMRRLSILDVAAGWQPYQNENGTLQCVFNGEIWNHRSLRRRLQALGHTITSDVDGAVICHLFEESGEKAFSYLDGMFGLALWDSRTQTLYLARDRQGIKPLLVRELAEGMAFASEIRPLLQLGGRPEIDRQAVEAYLMFRTVPGRQTLLKGVERVLPGEVVALCHGRVQKTAMAELRDVTTPISDPAEASALLQETLGHAVERHLQSDVPMGALLSGGLDSSLLVALAREQGQRLPSYCAGFLGYGDDGAEFEMARRVAEAVGVPLTEVKIPPESVSDRLVSLAHGQDEPLGDPTALPLSYVMERASQDVRVLLSGEGADELFAGYAIYHEPQDLEKWARRIPRELRPGLETLLSSLPGAPGAGLLRRLRVPLSERYLGIGTAFGPEGRDRILHEDVLSGRDYPDPVLWARAHFPSEAHPLDGMLAVDRGVWLADEVLLKLDRVSMRHGIEARVPYLDPDVVALSARLAPDLKVRGRTRKWILRQVGGSYLGDMADRDKKGFPVPIGRLLHGPLRELSWDVLTDSTARQRGLLRQSEVRGLLSNLPDGPSQQGRRVFVILMLELWLRQVLDPTCEAGELPLAEGGPDPFLG